MAAALAPEDLMNLSSSWDVLDPWKGSADRHPQGGFVITFSLDYVFVGTGVAVALCSHNQNVMAKDLSRLLDNLNNIDRTERHRSGSDSDFFVVIIEPQPSNQCWSVRYGTAEQAFSGNLGSRQVQWKPQEPTSSFWVATYAESTGHIRVEAGLERFPWCRLFRTRMPCPLRHIAMAAIGSKQSSTLRNMTVETNVCSDHASREHLVVLSSHRAEDVPQQIPKGEGFVALLNNSLVVCESPDAARSIAKKATQVGWEARTLAQAPVDVIYGDSTVESLARRSNAVAGLGTEAALELGLHDWALTRMASSPQGPGGGMRLLSTTPYGQASPTNTPMARAQGPGGQGWTLADGGPPVTGGQRDAFGGAAPVPKAGGCGHILGTIPFGGPQAQQPQQNPYPQGQMPPQNPGQVVGAPPRQLPPPPPLPPPAPQHAQLPPHGQHSQGQQMQHQGMCQQQNQQQQQQAPQMHQQMHPQMMSQMQQMPQQMPQQQAHMQQPPPQQQQRMQHMPQQQMQPQHMQPQQVQGQMQQGMPQGIQHGMQHGVPMQQGMQQQSGHPMQMPPSMQHQGPMGNPGQPMQQMQMQPSQQYGMGQQQMGHGQHMQMQMAPNQMGSQMPMSAHPPPPQQPPPQQQQMGMMHQQPIQQMGPQAGQMHQGPGPSQQQSMMQRQPMQQMMPMQGSPMQGQGQMSSMQGTMQPMRPQMNHGHGPEGQWMPQQTHAYEQMQPEMPENRGLSVQAPEFTPAGAQRSTLSAAAPAFTPGGIQTQQYQGAQGGCQFPIEEEGQWQGAYEQEYLEYGEYQGYDNQGFALSPDAAEFEPGNYEQYQEWDPAMFAQEMDEFELMGKGRPHKGEGKKGLGKKGKGMPKGKGKGKGEFAKGDFGKGDFAKGEFGKGEFAKGDFGKGDFGGKVNFGGKGDFGGKVDFGGKGDFGGKADFGPKGEFGGKGDPGKGEFGKGWGEKGPREWHEWQQPPMQSRPPNMREHIEDDYKGGKGRDRDGWGQDRERWEDGRWRWQEEENQGQRENWQYRGWKEGPERGQDDRQDRPEWDRPTPRPRQGIGRPGEGSEDDGDFGRGPRPLVRRRGGQEYDDLPHPPMPGAGISRSLLPALHRQPPQGGHPPHWLGGHPSNRGPAELDAPAGWRQPEESMGNQAARMQDEGERGVHGAGAHSGLFDKEGFHRFATRHLLGPSTTGSRRL